ncbi:MAG: hypothetical protein QOC78_209 [Solirubrobacteraceae bacterium]|nr:hypothetical protein [Solirubrobacteraceae bacterium]
MGALNIRTNLNAVLQWAPQVASDFLAGSLPRRRLKEVARAARSGKNAQAWWNNKRADFTVLLARSVRQRNAIIHGRFITPAVVATVGPFLELLSAYLANESTRACYEWADGRPCAAAGASADGCGLRAAGERGVRRGPVPRARTDAFWLAVP